MCVRILRYRIGEDSIIMRIVHLNKFQRYCIEILGLYDACTAVIGLGLNTWTTLLKYKCIFEL